MYMKLDDMLLNLIGTEQLNLKDLALILEIINNTNVVKTDEVEVI